MQLIQLCSATVNQIAASSCVLVGSTALTFVIGSGSATGASSVTISIAGYSSPLTISTLTVVPAPLITSFAPATAYTGCKITITGASFIQRHYSCVAFVGNPLVSAAASSTCSIESSDTIIFAVGNSTAVQANARIQVAFNKAVRATSSASSFLNVVAPPSPGAVPALEIWYTADVSNTVNFNSAPVNGEGISQWTDRSSASHNANNAGNNFIKPKWTSNVLNGYGVLRFSRSSNTYLDINPVAYLNEKPTYSVFIIARMLSFAANEVQYLVADSSNGLRIFFNGNQWCVQATLSSGVGCSSVRGDTNFHVFSLMFNRNAVGDHNRTRFRFDFVDQALTFAAGSSQSTGTFARWQIGGETSNNSPFHFNGDVAEIAVFTRSLSQCEAVGVEAYMREHWALQLEVLS